MTTAVRRRAAGSWPSMIDNPANACCSKANSASWLTSAGIHRTQGGDAGSYSDPVGTSAGSAVPNVSALTAVERPYAADTRAIMALAVGGGNQAAAAAMAYRSASRQKMAGSSSGEAVS